MRRAAVCLAALGLSFLTVPAAEATRKPAGPLFAVAYGTGADLMKIVAGGRADIVRVIPRLHVAEVRPNVAGFANDTRDFGGVRYVERVAMRHVATDPALFSTTSSGTPYEWQYAASHEDTVPAAVLRAAGSVKIAVIDTGADLSAPDIAAKSPWTYNLQTGGPDVRDVNGHGTFVSSLAAGSVANNDGVAGFGGDAQLLVIKAVRDDGSLTDVDEANGIMYAVDHGARVINLSVGGPATSATEQRAVKYASQHNVLIVAAVGNEYTMGNPVEYPAALLQPVGSRGQGGIGLAVGASTTNGSRAFFSNVGTQLSLVAPGMDVFGALSSLSSPDEYPRASLPGSVAGLYGFSSGTSFSSPEVAGAAALVMAANPFLRATDVAAILKQTATGHGAWNPDTGGGVLDAAAAVARARGANGLVVHGVRSGKKLRFQWFGAGTPKYRVSLRVDKGTSRVLLDNTTTTSVTVKVRHKHRYSFSVDALDANGAVTATTAFSYRA
jgi:subtilisin family serine protease